MTLSLLVEMERGFLFVIHRKKVYRIGANFILRLIAIDINIKQFPCRRLPMVDGSATLAGPGP